MSAPARGTSGNYSKGPSPSRARIDPAFLAAIALSAAAVAGPALLIVSDFTPLFEVQAVTAKLKAVSGGRNHMYAMLVIGLVAVPMAYGAIRPGSRPAMVAMVVLGLAAIGVALLKDLPDAAGENTLRTTYEQAQGIPQLGFYLETLGAVLVLIAGAGGLLLSGGRPQPSLGTAPRAADRDERQREQDAAARAAARAERPS